MNELDSILSDDFKYVEDKSARVCGSTNGNNLMELLIVRNPNAKASDVASKITWKSLSPHQLESSD